MPFSTKMNPALTNALIVYIVALLAIFLTKPRSLFNEKTKRPREFGLGFNRDKEKKTLFSLPVIVVFLAMICFVTSIS